eukprot:6758342-Karenia_brevis.AAC.1
MPIWPSPMILKSSPSYGSALAFTSPSSRCSYYCLQASPSPLASPELGLMTEVAELQYSTLSATETRKLRENLPLSISYFGQTISLGTACSGTDIWYGVWDILVRLWHKVL